MFYNDGFSEDENFRVTICPVCNNDNSDNSNPYCYICGQPLYNRCSNEYQCGEKLPSHYRYCPFCGYETTYKQQRLLYDWDIAIEMLLKKLEFEDNLCKSTGLNKNIDNWNDFLLILKKENYNFLYESLKCTSSKICGDTLLIYAANTNLKNYLIKGDYLNIIKEKAKVQFSINNVKVVCMDDFKSSIEKLIIDEIDVPF